jgi:hypothetical protein
MDRQSSRMFGRIVARLLKYFHPIGNSLMAVANSFELLLSPTYFVRNSFRIPQPQYEQDRIKEWTERTVNFFF